jgi:hypothetical protein
MREDDYDEFAALIDSTYDLIGKTAAAKIISGPAKAIFFQALADYPLPLVRSAIAAHCRDRKIGHFTPSPAHIIDQIEIAAQRDSRPGAEEAFATALLTRDEQRTVVWTQETAEAFALAMPVLEAAGVISGRKTFIEIYDRLVFTARAARVPAKWFPSPGLDKLGFDHAVKTAAAAGLLVLPAPTVVLIEGPEGGAKPESFTLSPRQQLDHIRKMMLDGVREKQRQADMAIDARIAAEDETTALIGARSAAYRETKEWLQNGGAVEHGERAIVHQAGNIVDESQGKE